MPPIGLRLATPLLWRPGCKAQNNFMLLLKRFITKVLEYKAGLKGRIKFICIAMGSLVMNLCSRDLHVTSLNNNYYNTLNSSRLTVVQFTQRLVFGWYNINLFTL